MVEPYIIMPVAVASLSVALGLPTNGQEQDWDIESADATRIKEFLRQYQLPGLSQDEKVALMALILASCDAAFDDTFEVRNSTWAPTETFQLTLWEETETQLRKDTQLHIPLIHYWGSIQESVGMIIPLKIQSHYSELFNLR